MNLELDNKKILITGSTRGIGYVTAKEFLAEGASVCITGKSESEVVNRRKDLISEYDDNKVIGFVGDLRNQEELENLKNIIIDKWGSLDVLVANIGSGKPQSNNPLDIDEWKRLMEINLYASVEAIDEFLPLLELSKGNIVLISSIVARETFGSSYAYAAGKGALLSLVKYTSKSFGEKGIRINAVLPGNVLFQGGRWEELIKENPKKVEKMIEREVPLKRFATPEEIADAVLFLSSSRASFITGSSIVVDGGQTSNI